ncbi:hypothetical protein ACT4XR_20220 (plasmid) [Acinetobacter baumannii]|uniref:hypothetical protein n=1 Tax=Acinetobacter baumannii TaxID=470 RepID=UPI0038915653
MKLFNKKVSLPDTTHNPSVTSNVHEKENKSFLTIQVHIDDNCTIHNHAPKLVSIPLPELPSFNYKIDFDQSTLNADAIRTTGEIPYKIIKFKAYLVLSSSFNSEKTDAENYEIADIDFKVFPNDYDSKSNEYFFNSTDEIKEYITGQWEDAFDSIISTYNLSSRNSSQPITGGYNTIAPTGNSAVSSAREPRIYNIFGHEFSLLQLILLVIVLFIVAFISLSLWGRYVNSKNGYANSSQNPYSSSSIDQQVQIAEDVVSRVQGKLGVPATAKSNDLGCLKDISN